MVENFRYKGYNGDANNPKYGQAVIKRKWVLWVKEETLKIFGKISDCI
jgi:hypothetical protein